MRILVADLERVWRGGQEQALFLLQGLQARGHRAELLAIGRTALARRAIQAGIAVHTVGGTTRGLGAAPALQWLLRRPGFDIVHANEAHALTAAWLGRAHRWAPLVAARRSVFPLGNGRIALARYRATSSVLAVSQAVATQLLAGGLDRGRITVVADGTEIPARITPEERSGARRRWGIAEREPVAAYVASLTAEKGHELALETFELLRRAVPGCRLLLAGEGPLDGHLRQRAKAQGLLPAAIFAGFVEQVRAVYAACDVFLFPSLSEGLGSSLLRAMAFALPVAALARGGIPEAIVDELNGLLVEEATPDSMAAAAARLFTEPELGRRLGEAARESVRAHFSADRMVEETLRIFERLAGPHEGA